MPALWWIRSFVLGTVQHLALRFRVRKDAWREGVRREPFVGLGPNGERVRGRATYQRTIADRLERWVGSVERMTARGLTRAHEKWINALDGFEVAKVERDRRLHDAKDARTPVLGRVKKWLILALLALLVLDVSVAYSPMERAGMPGLMTLVATFAVIVIMNGIAAAIGFVGWMVFVRRDHDFGYRGERVVRFVVLLGILVLLVAVGVFGWLRGGEGFGLLWAAVTVMSILLAVFIGAVHREGRLHHDVETAERAVARAQRKVNKAERIRNRKAHVARAVGLHQLAVASSVVARGDMRCTKAFEASHPDEIAPHVPDPGLKSEAEIVTSVLAPLAGRLPGDERRRLALEPGY